MMLQQLPDGVDNQWVVTVRIVRVGTSEIVDEFYSIIASTKTHITEDDLFDIETTLSKIVKHEPYTRLCVVSAVKAPK